MVPKTSDDEPCCSTLDTQAGGGNISRGPTRVAPYTVIDIAHQ